MRIIIVPTRRVAVGIQWVDSCKVLRTFLGTLCSIVVIHYIPFKSTDSYSDEAWRFSWLLFCQGKSTVTPTCCKPRFQRNKSRPNWEDGNRSFLSALVSGWFLQPGWSGNCSVVGRGFAFMMLLWIIFATFFVSLSTSWSHPSHRRILTRRDARQVPCKQSMLSKGRWSHTANSVTSFGRSQKQADFTILGLPNGKVNSPSWCNSILQVDEHRCKWEFPK